ncbi:MAG: efflux RND transporter periplasmic adaptor subunit [Phaeodactylibacter sp.]|nr:efflux RND transporter periplasmic adaptor subunit [Phaeodactylibacter sp.]
MKNIFFLLVLGLLMSVCKQDYSTQQPEAPKRTKKVTAVQLEVSNEALPVTASGVLASAEEIKFSFKIGGIIRELNFEKGQRVRKGQVLARLDQAEINAQVLQAQKGYDKAVRDLNRVERLLQDSVATLEQKQDATTAVEIAKATLDIAEFNQRYATISAPIDGKVLQKLAEENELVSPGQPIYVLGSTGNKGAQVVRIGVPDRQIVKLKQGDQATITFSAFPDRSYDARISELSEEANPFTGTFDVELSLDGYFPELRNGFVGYVQIQPDMRTGHYRIPMAALVEGDGKQASLFTSKDGQTVQKSIVNVSHIDDDFFIVDIKRSLRLKPGW